MLKLMEEIKSPGVIIKKDVTGKGINAAACLPGSTRESITVVI